MRATVVCIKGRNKANKLKRKATENDRESNIQGNEQHESDKENNIPYNSTNPNKIQKIQSVSPYPTKVKGNLNKLSFTHNIVKTTCDLLKRSIKSFLSCSSHGENDNKSRKFIEKENPNEKLLHGMSLQPASVFNANVYSKKVQKWSTLPLDENFCLIENPSNWKTVSSKMSTKNLEHYLNRKKKILKRSKTTLQPAHAICSTKDINTFLSLIEEDPIISLFLKRDICRRYADKYLLAMVLIYFVRANLLTSDFSRENFFAALYLAHDMEEDEEEIKYEIFPYSLGTHWKKYYTYLLSLRDDLFWSLNCRAVVSRKCCDKVMDLIPNHWIWERQRPEYHGNVCHRSKSHDFPSCPRGPFRSPVWCRSCLERECFYSDSSYIVYTSPSDSSSSEDTEDALNETNNQNKDSGFESILLGCHEEGKLSNTEFDLESKEVLPLSPDLLTKQ